MTFDIVSVLQVKALQHSKMHDVYLCIYWLLSWMSSYLHAKMSACCVADTLASLD